MGKNPAFLWYPGDWIQDTRCLSLAAKGAWIDLLCAMWRSSTRGRLSMPMIGYARQINASVDQAKAVIDELTDMQICDAVTEGNGNVTLMNRRMLREEKERISTRCRVQKHRNAEGKRSYNANVTPPSSVSVSVAVTKKEKKLPPIVPPKGDEEFEKFWNEFPKRHGQKRGKWKAFREWKALNPDQSLQEKILSALKTQKAAYEDCKKHGEFVPEFQDPERWLRNRRWEDEVTLKNWQERLKEIPG